MTMGCPLSDVSLMDRCRGISAGTGEQVRYYYQTPVLLADTVYTDDQIFAKNHQFD